MDTETHGIPVADHKHRIDKQEWRLIGRALVHMGGDVLKSAPSGFNREELTTILIDLDAVRERFTEALKD